MAIGGALLKPVRLAELMRRPVLASTIVDDIFVRGFGSPWTDYHVASLHSEPNARVKRSVQMLHSYGDSS